MREISFWDRGNCFVMTCTDVPCNARGRKRFRLLFFRFQDPAAGQMDKNESILLLLFYFLKTFLLASIRFSAVSLFFHRMFPQRKT